MFNETFLFFFFNVTPWVLFGKCGHPFHDGSTVPFLKSRVCLPAAFVMFANIKTWRYVMSDCCIVLWTLLYKSNRITLLWSKIFVYTHGLRHQWNARSSRKTFLLIFSKCCHLCRKDTKLFYISVTDNQSQCSSRSVSRSVYELVRITS